MNRSLHRSIMLTLVLALLLSLSIGSFSAQDAALDGFDPFTGTTDVDTLRALAARDGDVRLIVELAPSVIDSSSEVSRQASINAAQNTVLGAMAAHSVSGIWQYKYTPLLAITTDAAGVAALAAMPQVARLHFDALSRPTMDTSTTQIGVSGTGGAWEMGYEGTGWAVAVLDTGVDKTHPALNVISEACYSTNDAGEGSSSACPGGVEESTAVDSGLPCDLNIIGCDHGTHVAGTIASTDTTYTGVARKGDIIAVQVFSEFQSAIYCAGYPNNECTLTWNTDQIKGLERVYELRTTYDIASANMSLGGGQNFTACDSDNRKPIIDDLRAAGIATVIASGNSSFTDSVGTPACISSAITVGAVDDSDIVASFSNGSDLVDLMAPGVNIMSTLPGTGFGSKNGTSMATPHVAGAWALMREADPTATVDEIEAALESTGVTITDTRGGASNRQTPRIQVNDAITELLGGDFELLAPADGTFSRTALPSTLRIEFQGLDDATAYTWHLLKTAGTGMGTVASVTVNDNAVCSGSGSSKECDFQPVTEMGGVDPSTLDDGTYAWNITASTPDGDVHADNGPFSFEIAMDADFHLIPEVDQSFEGFKDGLDFNAMVPEANTWFGKKLTNTTLNCTGSSYKGDCAVVVGLGDRGRLVYNLDGSVINDGDTLTISVWVNASLSSEENIGKLVIKYANNNGVKVGKNSVVRFAVPANTSGWTKITQTLTVDLADAQDLSATNVFIGKVQFKTNLKSGTMRLDEVEVKVTPGGAGLGAGSGLMPLPLPPAN